MKAVVKKKRPLLTKRHRKDRLDFALSHQDWTMEDWKKVVWSDETKINRLGSDGRKWVWKKAGEALSNRLVEGTKKFKAALNTMAKPRTTSFSSRIMTPSIPARKPPNGLKTINMMSCCGLHNLQT